MLISRECKFHIKIKLLEHNFYMWYNTYITITWSCTLIHTHNNELTLMLNIWPFCNLDEMHILHILLQNEFIRRCKNLKICMVVYQPYISIRCVLYVLSVMTYVYIYMHRYIIYYACMIHILHQKFHTGCFVRKVCLLMNTLTFI